MRVASVKSRTSQNSSDESRSGGDSSGVPDAELRPLDLVAASRQAFDPTNFQPILFCASSFDEVYASRRAFLTRRS